MFDFLLFLIIGISVVMSLLIVIVTAAGFWRRKDVLSPDMLDSDPPTKESHPGIYLATYREGWTKTFDPAGFFRGGVGQFYINAKGVNFLIEGAHQPLFLPFPRITGAAIEEVGAGKHRGGSALVVAWSYEEKTLRSAFLIEGQNPADFVRTILSQIE